MDLEKNGKKDKVTNADTLQIINETRST